MGVLVFAVGGGLPGWLLLLVFANLVKRTSLLEIDNHSV